MAPFRFAWVLCIAAVSTFPAFAQESVLRDINGDPLPPKAFARLGALRFRIGEPAVAARFLDEGKTLLVKVSDAHYRTYGTFLSFSAQTGKELNRHVADSLAIDERSDAEETRYSPSPEWCISPDGSLIAKVVPTFRSKAQLQVRERATWMPSQV
jgi:hypothetical protein